MRGFSGGAMAGVAVGAAALAGLSLLAPPDAGPEEIAVVTEMAGETPPVDAAEGIVSVPSEAPVAENVAGAGGGEDLTAAESLEVPLASPAPEAPAVVEAAAMEAESAQVEPEAMTLETEVVEPAEPAPQVPVGPVAQEGAGVPVSEGAEADRLGEVPTPVEPPVAPMTEMSPPGTEVAAAEPAPDLALRPEEETVATVEPPSAPAAPEWPEQVATVPDEVAPSAPAALQAPPAAPSLEPSLAQAEEPALVQEAGTGPGETTPEGPVFESPPAGAVEAEVASVAPGEEPALPGRVTVGGQTLPGGGPVRVNRPGVEAEPVPEIAIEAAMPEAPAEAAPAVRRFAAAWDAPAEAKPLMSLVLLDDGTTDPATVAALPWPVSVALDPSREGAAERLAAYRAQGIEALVLAALPPAAQPLDVEVFLGAALDELPETVAVLDLGQGGLGGRDAAAQMGMSRVARGGHGLVLGDQGLRSGLELAGREGVPAAEVLRDLDGEGQDGAAIRRGLDDAVRRAGQEGQAVVVARVGPETLAALGEWSLEGRVQEVTVAPVSAVLGME